MALYYNLAKVYDISDNDSDFVLDIINLFVTEIPADMKNLKRGIKEKISKWLMLMLIKLSQLLICSE